MASQAAQSCPQIQKTAAQPSLAFYSPCLLAPVPLSSLQHPGTGMGLSVYPALCCSMLLPTLAICTAAMPTPPPAPRMSTVCPAGHQGVMLSMRYEATRQHLFI